MALLAGAALLAGCERLGFGDDEPKGDPVLAGGTTTVFNTSNDAYSLPAGNIPITDRARFFVGNAFFRQPWISAPASTTARDGLGPLYNTNSCQGCHIKDGRGHAPAGPDDSAVSMLVRLSVPAGASPGDEDLQALSKFGVIPHPVYGSQLQDHALPGLEPEARVRVSYSPVPVALNGGKTVTLRKPQLALVDPTYGPIGEDTLLSARMAPPMIGLGLLEAIPAEAIRAQVDPEDADSDGISGRVNTVWNFASGETALGRFGWKASQPSVRQQAAAAFNGDMGLTTTRFARPNCSQAQPDCLSARDGGSPEVSDLIMNKVVFYAKHLGVPARRNMDDPQVQRGKELFATADCGGCHRPRWTTGEDAPEYLAGQTIYPYTDLLLHDMGPALADGRPVFDAKGSEWRTPPLWGIGLAKKVSPQATFLHDGRARTLLEAILWHGGEAEAARDRVVAMTPEERKTLLAFLESL